MTFAELVPLILKISIVVLVFTVGLGTVPRELTHLLRHPGQLFRTFLSMNVIMLVVAVAIVKLFPLPGAVRVLLVTLALSPIPPLLPKNLMKAGGGRDYVMALLCTAALFAIVWIPLAGIVLDRVFPADIVIPPGPVATLVLMTVLAPTVAGVVVRMIAPDLAERAAGPFSKVAGILLLGAALLMLVKAGPAMLSVMGQGTLAAIIAFLILGLIVGHALGGPTPGDRSVLALATASRHPGIAIAIATILFPEEKAVIPAALLYLVMSIVVPLPYVAWRKKALAEDPNVTVHQQQPAVEH